MSGNDELWSDYGREGSLPHYGCCAGCRGQLFDTANIYGWGENSGLTETIIGRWFKQGGGRREKVVLATKVYGAMSDKLDGPNDEAGLSSYIIRRHLEGSLQRLQTDHIELYQMHHIDRKVSWE